MYCSKCGNKIEDDVEFCNRCGSKSSSDSETLGPINYKVYDVGQTNFKPKKKIGKGLIIVIICCLILVGSAIYIVISNRDSNSEDVGNGVSNNYSNIPKDEIIQKWQVTLPLNSTNGLEKVIYDSNSKELYLKYNMGICIVDTNNDPDDVDFVIPGNDDAVRSIKVMLGVLTNAICEANNLELVDYVSEEDKKDSESKENKKNVAKEQKEEVKVDDTVLEELKEMEEMDELESKTLTELKRMAKDKKIKGYSNMKKEELIKVLSK